MGFSIRFAVIVDSNTSPKDLNESMEGSLMATLDLANALNPHGKRFN